MHQHHRLLAGEPHPHKPVRNVVVVADPEGLAVSGADQHHHRGVEKRQRQNEQRQQNRETRM